MRLRIRRAVPALLLASALTVSLSACNENEGDNTSGEAQDTSRPVALPLPDGAEIMSASSEEEGKIISLRFEPTETMEEEVEAYLKKFSDNGYVSDAEDNLTRGNQKVAAGGNIKGSLALDIIYPDAPPPLPSDGEVNSVTSKNDDTLTLTYKLPARQNNMLSLKGYMRKLNGAGWDTPPDDGNPMEGVATATKGDQKMKFDISQNTRIKVILDVPSSVS
ncbi:hypothetical protein [Streptomyces sp. NPDC047108]|uniref:hypothetical protein n=1 Tax=Streptomyces sp. NPDC047108 TaxID=3155025 RepID=UPI0033C22F54